MFTGVPLNPFPQLVLTCWASFFMFAAEARSDEPEVDWPNPTFDPIVASGVAMTHIAHAGDGSGRLFVTQQSGNIVVLEGGQLSSTRFLSITDRVLAGGERGLLSIAFPKDFKSRREFYVNYTRKPDGATVVSRFRTTADGKMADPEGEQVLLLLPQPSPIHNGGQIAFGPDGFLYIGTGDGGGQGDPGNTSQNPKSLLGKMLRIDVSGSISNYSIPPSNPFVHRSDVLPEIWAFGLRNPWRFSFDLLTRDLLISDVGQSAQEEINFQSGSSSGGENYGWSVYEGNLAFRAPTNDPYLPTYTFPVAAYGRSFGSSITGGHVVRTTPSERIYGVYIFSDFMSGRIGGLKKVGTNWILADFGVYRRNGQTLQITSFGEDEGGNVYALESGFNNVGGSIFRLRDDKRVHKPVFSLPSGTYDTERTQTITTLTSGARIHYTFDGTDPTESSPSIASGESLVLDESRIVKARAFRADLLPSPIVTGTYTMAISLSLSPGAGPVTNGTPLTMSTSVSNVVIHYTLDGTAPTGSSPVYSGPIEILGNQSLRTIGIRAGWISAETNIFYGLLIPEWVTVQTYAGGGVGEVADGPARVAKFSRPISLAINPAGEVFVGELGPLPIGPNLWAFASIRKISTTGFVSTLWTNIGLPTALASDASGAIFIGKASEVLKSSDGGTPSHYNGGAASMPRGIVVDEFGNTYVVDKQSLHIRSSTGEFLSYRSLWEATDLGLARAPDKTIMLGGFFGVIFFNADNQPVPYVGGVNSDHPLGHADGPRLSARLDLPGFSYNLLARFRAMAYDRYGNLLISDVNRVRKVSTNGLVSTLVDRFPGQPGWKIGPIGGMALHPNGDVFLVDTRDATVKRISADVDRDGVPDVDENGAFSIGRDDRLFDEDADGVSNSTEYLAGTDPQDSSSRPRLHASIDDGNVTLRWSGTPKGDLVLGQSADLVNWSTPTNKFNSGVTTVPTVGKRAYFRARAE